MLIAPPLIITHAEIDILLERFEQTLKELTETLLNYMMQEKETFEDSTIKRYRVAKDLPDYAIGAIDNIDPVQDANITSAMESGHTRTEQDFFNTLPPAFTPDEDDE